MFQGQRNYMILALAVCFALTGSFLTGLSKWEVWNKNSTTTITTATSDAITTTTTSLTTSSN